MFPPADPVPAAPGSPVPPDGAGVTWAAPDRDDGSDWDPYDRYAGGADPAQPPPRRRPGGRGTTYGRPTRPGTVYGRPVSGAPEPRERGPEPRERGGEPWRSGPEGYDRHRHDPPVDDRARDRRYGRGGYERPAEYGHTGRERPGYEYPAVEPRRRGRDEEHRQAGNHDDGYRADEYERRGGAGFAYGIPFPPEMSYGRPGGGGTIYTSASYGQHTMRMPPAAGEAPGQMPELAAEEAGASVARHSSVMAVWSLVSRFTGALRTTAIGWAIGGALVADDYNVANTLPNMAYELLLGGVLASVVVPLLVRARARDADRGEAYTHRLLTLATVFLGGATVLAVLLAPQLTALMANAHTSAADRHLTTVLGYLLLPEIFFYGMAALFAAVLNTRNHFAAPMWTPILNNIVVIATAGLFRLLPHTGALTATSITATQTLVLGVGTTLGIVVQAAGLVPALRRVRFRWRWRWDWRALHLSELARIGGWALGYVVASQVGVFAVVWIANYAAAKGGAGPAIYMNSYLIFGMAHGIVAVSIITALMPRLSAAAAEHRYGDVTQGLSLGTRLSAVLLIPISVAYLVLGHPLAKIVFGYGEYSPAETRATGTVIAWAALGLVPFAISQLQMFTFYAMPDTRTPALINVPAVVLRILVDFLFLAVLPVTAVVSGLMVGNAVSYLLACAIGYSLLRRRLGPLGLRGVAVSLTRMTVAALVAAVPTLLVVLGMEHLVGTGWVSSFLQLAFGGVVLGAAYVAVALALRTREVTEVWGMLRARLGR